MARVQEWRKNHPGYSRGKKGKKAVPALQDFAPTQGADAEDVAEVLKGLSSIRLQKEGAEIGANGQKEAALQDLAPAQDPLVVGLISALIGSALQENVAPVFWNLVEQGQRILERNPADFGRRAACA